MCTPRIVIQGVDFVPTRPVPNYGYEAVALLGCDHPLAQAEAKLLQTLPQIGLPSGCPPSSPLLGIVFPELPLAQDNQVMGGNASFLFNFDNNQRVREVQLQTNGMYPFRITDATDVDACGYLWLLALNRLEVPPYSDEPTNFRSLIRAHFDGSTVRFLSKFDIPGAGSPNLEALVRLDSCPSSPPAFLAFSANFSALNGQGILLLELCPEGQLVLTELQMGLCGQQVLSPAQYDTLQISSAFRGPNGSVVLVPQNNAQLLFLDAKCLRPEVLRRTKLLCARAVALLVDGTDLPGTYQGIESMSMDACGRLAGTTEWDLDGTTFARPFSGFVQGFVDEPCTHKA